MEDTGFMQNCLQNLIHQNFLYNGKSCSPYTSSATYGDVNGKEKDSFLTDNNTITFV